MRRGLERTEAAVEAAAVTAGAPAAVAVGEAATKLSLRSRSYESTHGPTACGREYLSSHFSLNGILILPASTRAINCSRSNGLTRETKNCSAGDRIAPL